MLARTGAAQRLLGVVDEPAGVEGVALVDLWRGHLGYTRLTNRQVRLLARSSEGRGGALSSG